MTFNLQHYVYYDYQTGEVTEVTWRKPTEKEFALEIDYDTANGFLSGKVSSLEYQILYLKGKLELVKKDNLFNNHVFKQKTFYYIDKTLDSYDCQVILDLKKFCWNFSLSNEVKNDLNSNIVIPQLIFFVTLKTDLDFLIRMIEIKTTDLIENDSYQVDFDTGFEKDGQKISISTYAIFKDYSLKVIK